MWWKYVYNTRTSYDKFAFRNCKENEEGNGWILNHSFTSEKLEVDIIWFIVVQWLNYPEYKKLFYETIPKERASKNFVVISQIMALRILCEVKKWFNRIFI